jgi:TonB family protein
MVRPIYPPDAQLAGIKGIVVIELTLDPGGRVRDARVLRSVHPSLDRAALDAVKQWVYEPTLEHGVPVPVITNITVRFELG